MKYSARRHLTILFVGVLIGEHRRKNSEEEKSFKPMGRIGSPMGRM
jgi:hypothetical protein